MDSKRKRGDVSSVSELDTSTNSPETSTKSKPKKKKPKNSEDQTQKIAENPIQETKTNETSNDLSEQLKMINHKLSNVLTKDDVNLKSMIKEIVQQMKVELIATVSNKIDVLEGRLLDKEEENEKLLTQNDTLNKQIDKQNDEYKTLKSSQSQSNQTTNRHFA